MAIITAIGPVTIKDTGPVIMEVTMEATTHSTSITAMMLIIIITDTEAQVAVL